MCCKIGKDAESLTRTSLRKESRALWKCNGYLKVVLCLFFEALGSVTVTKMIRSVVFAAHSVKFKMISAAPQLVPNIKPCQPNLIVGQVCDFVVTISNPLNHPVSMSFSIPSTDEPLPRWVTGQPVYGLKVPPAAITLLNRNCASGIDEKGKEAVTTLPDDDSM